MDSKLFLAENVLNERRPVSFSQFFLSDNVLNKRQQITYRLLSRATKVSANRAKQYGIGKLTRILDWH